MLLCRFSRAPGNRGGLPGFGLLRAGGQKSMPKKRAKKKTFSAVKAVKANARERVGQPKPERVLPDTAKEDKRRRKHPRTLPQLLSEED
jgi:hypothetical protein